MEEVYMRNTFSFDKKTPVQKCYFLVLGDRYCGRYKICINIFKGTSHEMNINDSGFLNKQS